MGRRKTRRKKGGDGSFSKAQRKRALASLPSEPVIDVVMPVWGEFERAKQALAALEEVKGDHQLRLYLVDDASSPPLSKAVNLKEVKGFDRIWIRRNLENRGFVASVNRGAGGGNGFLILLLNTDVVLQPGAIDAMVQEFQDPLVGVVGIKLVFPEDSRDAGRPAGKIQHAGMVVGIDGKPFHVHIGWSPDHPRVNRRQEVQMVTGACMMTRRSLWSEIGGFAEVYGRGTYEDMEYCVAVRSLGSRVIYQPEAWGYHFVGASALSNKTGFPVKMNEAIWKLRCGNLVVWDEWRFW